MRRIHYWVGFLAALLLFIQSVFSIYTYFQQKSMQQNAQAFFQQRQSNFQSQDSNPNSSDNSSSAGQNGTSSFNGQNRNFYRGQMNFNRQGNTFTMTLRRLQNNIISLLIMLIISGSGLVLSIIVGMNRKKNAEPA